MSEPQFVDIAPLKKKDWLLILTVLAFAFFIRVYGISQPEEIYFDEIYYPKAAEDYLQGRRDSNAVHPPAGKIQIAAGMFFCSCLNLALPDSCQLSPAFQRRFTPLLAGTLSVWLTFLLAYHLSGGNRPLSLLAMFFVAIDFMSLVMSRISTLDSLVSVWILLAAYCAWRYIEKCERSQPQAWDWAAFSALSLGVATACKWNGLFAALIIFLLVFGLALPRSTTVTLDSFGDESEPAWQGWRERWHNLLANNSWRRSLILVATFSLLPALVYLLSYIPLFWREGFLTCKSWKVIYDAHMLMLTFRYDPHQFTHNYLSSFWQWPLVIRPIWLYYEGVGSSAPATYCQGIVAFGNVIFWWTGMVYVGELFVIGLQRNSRAFLFFTLLWLAQWLCWAISTTGGFIYYMLPGIPFMAIASAFIVEDWDNTKMKYLVVGYIVLICVFFILYYPVLTNEVISVKYFNEIFPSWLPRWR